MNVLYMGKFLPMCKMLYMGKFLPMCKMLYMGTIFAYIQVFIMCKLFDSVCYAFLLCLYANILVLFMLIGFWYSGDTFDSNEVKAHTSSETIYWIPKVPDEYLPKKNMIFDEVEKAILFYFRYADRAGFNCRRGSVKYVKGSKDPVHKYVICSRAGKAEGCSVEGLQAETGKLKRKYPSQMRECKARIGIKIMNKSGRCFVHSFNPTHNHEMFTKSTVHMSRARRQLDYFDKMLIWQLYQSNVGSVRAHGIVSALKGGIEKHGAKKVDFKNFSRDLNCYMNDTDANLLFNMLEKRSESVKGFSFYHLLEKEELRGLFWADPIAKRNYKEFSDVVSFDATYRTNK